MLSPANIEQLNQSFECFTICHLAQLHGFTRRIAAKPNLLEVTVEFLDDIRSMLFQNGQSLAVRKAKYQTIHLGPELCSPSGQHMNWLAHLRYDSDNTPSASRYRVGLLPLFIKN